MLWCCVKINAWTGAIAKYPLDIRENPRKIRAQFEFKQPDANTSSTPVAPEDISVVIHAKSESATVIAPLDAAREVRRDDNEGDALAESTPEVVVSGQRKVPHKRTFSSTLSKDNWTQFIHDG
jgi:hypothetical protein